MKKIRGGFRAALLMGATASLLVFAAGAVAQDRNSDDNWGNFGRQGDPWHFGNPAPSDNTSPTDNPWPYNKVPRSPVLAVVGDISCQSGEPSEPGQPDQPGAPSPGEAANELCDNPATPPAYTSTSLWQSQEATANQIEAMKPDAVALLGDLQYQVGRLSDFESSFDLTYGAFKFLQRPAPGNHEFYDEHGQTGNKGYGYFSYFNGYQISSTGSPITTTVPDPCPTPNASCKAGKTPTVDLIPQPIPRADGQAGHFDLVNGGVNGAGLGDGWYSYNLGSWHLISLNIECYTQPDTPGADGCLDTNAWLTAETNWLKKDLDENQAPCTLAYWHQPTYSAADSLTEEGITAGTWWQLLYEHGADLVLNGHDHLYARYAPIKPVFNADDTSVTGVAGTWLGTADPKRGIREFIVGTGGETLDAVVNAPTSATDYDGAFNQQFLQAASGDFWGVMKLTLDPDGYKWDFESALAGPTAAVNGPSFPPANASGGYSDTGSGTCHGGPNQE